MWRVLWYCVKLAIIVGVAVFLATYPGDVTIEWLDHEVTMSTGILVLLIVVFAVIVAYLYRYWRTVYGAPGAFGRFWDNNRKRRGYKALSKGMVAVAAGDAAEANRLARKAEDLLQEPPLTLLLSAQAAQLNGDDRAAKRYFESMLEKEETRFLGLRGLVLQALRDGDDAAALEYVRRAHAIKPNAPWVLTTLFELSERTGDMATAEKALASAAKAKALPAPEAGSKRAALYLEQALSAERDRKLDFALSLARKALKQKPDMLAASLTTARIATALGRQREAQKILERAWAQRPQPDIAKAYLAVRPDLKPIDQVKRIKKLTNIKMLDPESYLALAEVSLEAELWGEVRRNVDAALGDDAPSARVCRLMARLEEGEHGNTEAARRWLERAASAPQDPTWVCASCGALSKDWTAHCAVCEAFDSLAWGLPPGAALAVTEGEAIDAEVVESEPLAEAHEPGEKGAERALPAT